MKIVQIRNVPDELHRAFKAEAATQGATMTEALRALMRAFVAGQTRLREKA